MTISDDAPVASGARTSGVAATDGPLRPRRHSAAPPPAVVGPGFIPPPPRAGGDAQRYYLCCLEPGGEFVEVIVTIGDAGRRRYFTTRDGARLTEVDEGYFVRRSTGAARSMLELDDREMRELEDELQFVRPVHGQHPLADPTWADVLPSVHQAVDEADADADREAELEPVAAVEAVALADDEVPLVPAAVAADDPADADVAVDADVADDADDAESAVEDDDEDDPSDDPWSDPVPGAAAPPAPPPAPAPPPSPQPVASDPRTTWTIEEFEAVMNGTMIEPETDSIRSATQPSPEAAAQVALAKGIAFTAHRGQADHVGAAFIDHPGRLAERFDPLDEPEGAAAAWLHDVLDRTDLTAPDLLEAGVVPAVVEVVQLLTRTPEISDEVYYARIRRHPLARRLKLAELDDDTAPWRIRRLDYETRAQLALHRERARVLLGA